MDENLLVLSGDLTASEGEDLAHDVDEPGGVGSESRDRAARSSLPLSDRADSVDEDLSLEGIVSATEGVEELGDDDVDVLVVAHALEDGQGLGVVGRHEGIRNSEERDPRSEGSGGSGSGT